MGHLSRCLSGPMAGGSRDTFVIVRQLLQWNCRPGNDGRAPHDKLSPSRTGATCFFVTTIAATIAAVAAAEAVEAASMDQIALTWLPNGRVSPKQPSRPVIASLCLRHSFLHDCPRLLATPEWLSVEAKRAKLLCNSFVGLKLVASL